MRIAVGGSSFMFSKAVTNISIHVTDRIVYAIFYATHPKQHDMVYGISHKCLTAMAQARLLLIQVSKQYGVWCNGGAKLM